MVLVLTTHLGLSIGVSMDMDYGLRKLALVSTVSEFFES